jgi:chaperone modulatory protein CbpM
MRNELLPLLSGELLDEEIELTLGEVCRACRLPAERLPELVDEGVIEPLGRDPSHCPFRGV